jgi:hypothetical protein
MFNKYIKNIGLKGGQIISLPGAPIYLGLAVIISQRKATEKFETSSPYHSPNNGKVKLYGTAIVVSHLPATLLT